MKVTYFLILKLILIVILTPSLTFSEPFVVLEYRSNSNYENLDNPFISDQNYSLKHKVKK